MEIAKMGPGWYVVRKNDVIVGYLDKRYEHASGDRRYVGHAPGGFVWDILNLDEDGKPGYVVATCVRMAEAKQAADRLLSG